MSIIEKVILKNIGEGYCILTPQKIFPYVEYVDWLEGEDEEAAAREIIEMIESGLGE